MFWQGDARRAEYSLLKRLGGSLALPAQTRTIRINN